MKTTHEIMKCIPVRLFDSETSPETGKTVIIRPKYGSKLGKTLFEPFLKKKDFRINLDDLGTVTWKNCDGKNSVEEIGKILGAHFGPEIEPIYDRLTKFLIRLHKEKFISLDCPSDG